MACFRYTVHDEKMAIADVGLIFASLAAQRCHHLGPQAVAWAEGE
jgi:hypothetical protein